MNFMWMMHFMYTYLNYWKSTCIYAWHMRSIIRIVFKLHRLLWMTLRGILGFTYPTDHAAILRAGAFEDQSAENVGLASHWEAGESQHWQADGNFQICRCLFGIKGCWFVVVAVVLVYTIFTCIILRIQLLYPYIYIYMSKNYYSY